MCPWSICNNFQQGSKLEVAGYASSMSVLWRKCDYCDIVLPLRNLLNSLDSFLNVTLVDGQYAPLPRKRYVTMSED